MTTVTQKIPSGYKQTDIGVIPADWNIKRLGDIAQFNNGKAHEQFISDAGRYVVVNSKFISTEGEVFKTSDKNLSPLFAGDIVMVMSDIPNGKALAKCFYIEKSEKYTLNQRICSFKSKEADGLYLFYKLNRNKYFLDFDSGVGQTNLKKGEVLDCPVALPSNKNEQVAISKALSDANILIEKIEQLIEKKKNIKQGAMQELLTGKRRLPGFSGKWETEKLGDVADFEHGRNLPKSDLSEDGNYKCIHYGQLFTVYQELIRDIKSRTNVDEGCFYSKANDVLMPTSDVTPRGLATATCIKEDGVILGGGIMVIRFKSGYDGLYFSYFVSQNKTTILKLVKGSTVFHLYAGDLTNLEINFPSPEEQTAIATILSDMDIEIEKLESQLLKYQNIKQGMMQTLLTGKIRLLTK
jgi:type I restriction enzyme S subunit